jgi:hypothetical protein
VHSPLVIERRVQGIEHQDGYRITQLHSRWPSRSAEAPESPLDCDLRRLQNCGEADKFRACQLFGLVQEGEAAEQCIDDGSTAHDNADHHEGR